MAPLPETVSAYSFNTVYNCIQYTVLPAERGIRRADEWVGYFLIFQEKSQEPIFKVSIKITGSLAATWQLQADVAKSNRLINELGQAAIVLALELESLVNNQQITFDTYNSSPAIELEIFFLKQKHASAVDEHRIFSNTVSSAIKDQNLFKSESHRDYLNFKLKNIAEIRALLLQLASVSAVIVAGILALNHDGLNVWVVISLIIFVMESGLASMYVLRVLEKLDKDFRKTITDSEAKINAIERKELDFVNSPSVNAANELKQFYSEIRDQLSKNKLTEVRSDWPAWALLWAFLAGLMFLAGGYLYQNRGLLAAYKSKVVLRETKRID